MAIPARLSGRKADTGGRLEILLLRRLKPKVWETLVRPGKRVKIGSRLELAGDSLTADRQELKVLPEVVELKSNCIFFSPALIR